MRPQHFCIYKGARRSEETRNPLLEFSVFLALSGHHLLRGLANLSGEFLTAEILRHHPWGLGKAHDSSRSFPGLAAKLSGSALGIVEGVFIHIIIIHCLQHQ